MDIPAALYDPWCLAIGAHVSWDDTIEMEDFSEVLLVLVLWLFGLQTLLLLL